MTTTPDDGAQAPTFTPELKMSFNAMISALQHFGEALHALLDDGMWNKLNEHLEEQYRQMNTFNTAQLLELTEYGALISTAKTFGDAANQRLRPNARLPWSHKRLKIHESKAYAPPYEIPPVCPTHGDHPHGGAKCLDCRTCVQGIAHPSSGLST